MAPLALPKKEAPLTIAFVPSLAVTEITQHQVERVVHLLDRELVEDLPGTSLGYPVCEGTDRADLDIAISAC